MINAALLLLILGTGTLSAQQMYRCKTPDGKVAFQDQPCAAGAAQSTVGQAAATGPETKVRPVDGMTPGEKRDWDALYRRYIEVFRIVGRAKACEVPGALEKYQALIERVKQRHGDNDPAFYAATIGYTAGSENHPVAELGEKKPPPPERCEFMVGPLQRAALPPVPASIALREGEPVDRVVNEGKTRGGDWYRFIARQPPAGGTAEHLLIHRDRIVYRSAEPFDPQYELWSGGSTPVIAFATVNHARKCLDGRPYKTWRTVSLPQSGASAMTKLAADCMDLAMSKEGFCTRQGERSHLYRISDTGEVSATGADCNRGQTPIKK